MSFLLRNSVFKAQICENSLQNSLFAGNLLRDRCDQHCVAMKLDASINAAWLKDVALGAQTRVASKQRRAIRLSAAAGDIHYRNFGLRSVWPCARNVGGKCPQPTLVQCESNLLGITNGNGASVGSGGWAKRSWHITANHAASSGIDNLAALAPRSMSALACPHMTSDYDEICAFADGLCIWYQRH
jgi:hypothetical protein